MEAGFGHGDTVQGYPVGKHGRRKAGKVPDLPTPWIVRESVPHQRFRPRTRLILGELHQHAR